MTFTPADGTAIERKISECRFTLPQGEAFSPVILGAEGDEALLGAVTLEVPGMARPEYVSDDLEAARGRLPDAARPRRMESFVDPL